MNLGQLRAALDRRTGVALDPAAAKEYLNEANRAIAADHDWPWHSATATFSTVAGTDTYTPPADWLRTIALRLSDDVPMNRRSISDLDEWWPNPTVTGTPIEYAIHGDSLILRPVPNGAVSIVHRYVRLPVELVQDTDTPAMPALFHDAVVDYAAAIVMRRTGEAVREQGFLRCYADWRTRMLDDARRFAGPAKVKIRRRFW